MENYAFSQTWTICYFGNAHTPTQLHMYTHFLQRNRAFDVNRRKNYCDGDIILGLYSYIMKQVDWEHILIYGKVCGSSCRGGSAGHTHTHTWELPSTTAVLYCQLLSSSAAEGEVMLPCFSKWTSFHKLGRQLCVIHLDARFVSYLLFRYHRHRLHRRW